MGMFDGTGLLAVWFSSAQQRPSRGVYWSIFAPALIAKPETESRCPLAPAVGEISVKFEETQLGNSTVRVPLVRRTLSIKSLIVKAEGCLNG